MTLDGGTEALKVGRKGEDVPQAENRWSWCLPGEAHQERWSLLVGVGSMLAAGEALRHTLRRWRRLSSLTEGQPTKSMIGVDWRKKTGKELIEWPN